MQSSLRLTPIIVNFLHIIQLQGKIGRVKCIKDFGDLVVTYNGLNGSVMLNPEVVAKVNSVLQLLFLKFNLKLICLIIIMSRQLMNLWSNVAVIDYYCIVLVFLLLHFDVNYFNQVDIQHFERDDIVQILDDKEKAMKLQRDFGILWLEEMNDVRNNC